MTVSHICHLDPPVGFRAGTGVAVYAAIAATASLIWQVYFWWSEQRARVRLASNTPFGLRCPPCLAPEKIR